MGSSQHRALLHGTREGPQRRGVAAAHNKRLFDGPPCSANFEPPAAHGSRPAARRGGIRWPRVTFEGPRPALGLGRPLGQPSSLGGLAPPASRLERIEGGGRGGGRRVPGDFIPSKRSPRTPLAAPPWRCRGGALPAAEVRIVPAHPRCFPDRMADSAVPGHGLATAQRQFVLRRRGGARRGAAGYHLAGIAASPSAGTRGCALGCAMRRPERKTRSVQPHRTRRLGGVGRGGGACLILRLPFPRSKEAPRLSEHHQTCRA